MTPVPSRRKPRWMTMPKAKMAPRPAAIAKRRGQGPECRRPASLTECPRLRRKADKQARPGPRAGRQAARRCGCNADEIPVRPPELPGQFLHIVRHLLKQRRARRGVHLRAERQRHPRGPPGHLPAAAPSGGAHVHDERAGLRTWPWRAPRRCSVPPPGAEALGVRARHHHRPSRLGRVAQPRRRVAGRAAARLPRVLLQR